MIKFPIYGKIKAMFQTTNQCMFLYHQYGFNQEIREKSLGIYQTT
jgi:hypothetical protein